MGRRRWLLLVLAGVLAFSACEVRTEIAITVNKDGSGTFELLVADDQGGQVRLAPSGSDPFAGANADAGAARPDAMLFRADPFLRFVDDYMPQMMALRPEQLQLEQSKLPRRVRVILERFDSFDEAIASAAWNTYLAKNFRDLVDPAALRGAPGLEGINFDDGLDDEFESWANEYAEGYYEGDYYADFADDDYCTQYPEDCYGEGYTEEDYCAEYPEDCATGEDDYCTLYPEDCATGEEGDYCTLYPEDCLAEEPPPEEDYCTLYPEDCLAEEPPPEDDFYEPPPDDGGGFEDYSFHPAAGRDPKRKRPDLKSTPFETLDGAIPEGWAVRSYNEDGFRGGVLSYEFSDFDNLDRAVRQLNSAVADDTWPFESFTLRKRGEEYVFEAEPVDRRSSGGSTSKEAFAEMDRRLDTRVTILTPTKPNIRKSDVGPESSFLVRAKGDAQPVTVVMPLEGGKPIVASAPVEDTGTKVLGFLLIGAALAVGLSGLGFGIHRRRAALATPDGPSLPPPAFPPPASPSPEPPPPVTPEPPPSPPPPTDPNPPPPPRGWG